MSAGTRRAPRKRRSPRAGVNPFAGRDMSPAEAITEALRKVTGPQPTLTFDMPGTRKPSFTPASPAATGAQPVLRDDPLDSSMPVEPSAQALIGDSIPAPEMPEPEPEIPPEYRVPTDSRPMLSTRPGWAGLKMDLYIRDGVWDELPRQIEDALGRNAAEAARAYRHTHERITDAARRVCLEAGAPHMTGTLLRRVHEMTVANRQGTGPHRTAFLPGWRHAAAGERRQAS